VELNVLYDDNFVVSLGEKRIVDNLLNIGLIALGQGQQRLRVSQGRVAQAFAFQILANALEQRSYSPTHLLKPYLCMLGSFVNRALEISIVQNHHRVRGQANTYNYNFDAT